MNINGNLCWQCELAASSEFVAAVRAAVKNMAKYFKFLAKHIP